MLARIARQSWCFCVYFWCKRGLLASEPTLGATRLDVFFAVGAVHVAALGATNVHVAGRAASIWRDVHVASTAACVWRDVHVASTAGRGTAGRDIHVARLTLATLGIGRVRLAFGIVVHWVLKADNTAGSSGAAAAASPLDVKDGASNHNEQDNHNSDNDAGGAALLLSGCSRCCWVGV